MAVHQAPDDESGDAATTGASWVVVGATGSAVVGVGSVGELVVDNPVEVVESELALCVAG